MPIEKQILGPMLFQIYINYISESLTGLARLFADDTSLSFSSTDPTEIERILNATNSEVMITSNIYFDYDIKTCYG